MIHCPSESYHFSIINKNNAVVKIGKYTSIATGLHIVCDTHPSLTHNTVSNYPMGGVFKIKSYPLSKTGGTIIIGNDVWIGEGVKIVGECTVGDGAIVGAFTVVAKDIPPYAIVVGSSQRIIRYRFTSEQIDKLLKIKWWNFSKEKVIEAIKYMHNIDAFISRYEKTLDIK